jgi:hypothetical protein
MIGLSKNHLSFVWNDHPMWRALQRFVAPSSRIARTTTGVADFVHVLERLT